MLYKILSIISLLFSYFFNITIDLPLSIVEDSTSIKNTEESTSQNSGENKSIIKKIGEYIIKVLKEIDAEMEEINAAIEAEEKEAEERAANPEAQAHRQMLMDYIAKLAKSADTNYQERVELIQISKEELEVLIQNMEEERKESFKFFNFKDPLFGNNFYCFSVEAMTTGPTRDICIMLSIGLMIQMYASSKFSEQEEIKLNKYKQALEAKKANETNITSNDLEDTNDTNDTTDISED